MPEINVVPREDAAAAAGFAQGWLMGRIAGKADAEAIASLPAPLRRPYREGVNCGRRASAQPHQKDCYRLKAADYAAGQLHLAGAMLAKIRHHTPPELLLAMLRDAEQGNRENLVQDQLAYCAAVLEPARRAVNDALNGDCCPQSGGG